jgi:hypothetical protein
MMAAAGAIAAGTALPAGAMGPQKPCACDTSYYSGPASLIDLRVAGLWMADLSLRSWFNKRILQGAASYCDQPHSDDFCDCPEECEQPQAGTIVTNSHDIQRYTKCCPFKFTLCCGCSGSAKKSCMQKCIKEAFDPTDGAPIKSHLTFCGYACSTCHREFWPANDEGKRIISILFLQYYWQIKKNLLTHFLLFFIFFCPQLFVQQRKV